MITGFVLASSVPGSHETAIEKLRTFAPRPIRDVYTTTGRYNLLIRVEEESATQMMHFLFRTMLELKDIQKTYTFFPCHTEQIPGSRAEVPEVRSR